MRDINGEMEVLKGVIQATKGQIGQIAHYFGQMMSFQQEKLNKDLELFSEKLKQQNA